MGLYVADPDTGFVHGEAVEMDRKIKQGDGIMWRGDPTLELRMGVLTAKRGGYSRMAKRYVHRGEIVARRYEVWRHTENGEDLQIGHWRLEEFDRILLDLVQMDPRTPGHVDVTTRLEQAEKKKEKEVSDQLRDALGPMLEHQMALARDLANPQTTFYQVGGQRDEKKAEAPSTDA